MDEDPLGNHVVLEMLRAVAAKRGLVELVSRLGGHVRVDRVSEQGSGMPTAAASRTPATMCSTSSTSRGTTFSPRDLNTSSRRLTK